MRTFRNLLVAALLAASIVLLGPAGPARADCAALEFPPEGSPVVFSGTAEEQRGGHFRFEVDRVWVGPDLAPHVWVRGSEDDRGWLSRMLIGMTSSIDAEFDLGDDYVVGATTDFSTNTCTVVEAESVATPDDARKPVAGGDTGADPPLPGTVVAALVLAPLVALVAAVVAWRRSRRALAADRGQRPAST